VNGSVEAFLAVGSLPVLGSVDDVSGAVVFVGVLSSFDGDVPVVGVGVGVVAAGVVVGVVVVVGGGVVVVVVVVLL
jgi:hypothetical protein